ncbi:MAG: hypothetical protein ACK5P7_10150 [Bdellovibrio sp.]|jgi:hypothetical protein
MKFRLLVFVFTLMAVLLSLPACVSLATRIDDRPSKHELMLAEFRAEREKSEKKRISEARSRQVPTFLTNVYRRGPFEPEEWDRTTNKLGGRRSLSGPPGMRFQSLHSEAGWTSSSGRFYQNAAIADRIADLDRADSGAAK